MYLSYGFPNVSSVMHYTDTHPPLQPLSSTTTSPFKSPPPELALLSPRTSSERFTFASHKTKEDITDDKTLINIAHTPGGSMVVVCSTSSLYVFNGRPRAVLATYTREASSVQEFGSNQILRWHPSLPIIALVTTRGYIYFLHLIQQADDHSKAYVVGLPKVILTWSI
jgi:hypothetical protein